jgi:hypothetical protein
MHRTSRNLVGSCLAHIPVIARSTRGSDSPTGTATEPYRDRSRCDDIGDWSYWYELVSPTIGVLHG